MNDLNMAVCPHQMMQRFMCAYIVERNCGLGPEPLNGISEIDIEWHNRS